MLKPARVSKLTRAAGGDLPRIARHTPEGARGGMGAHPHPLVLPTPQKKKAPEVWPGECTVPQGRHGPTLPESGTWATRDACRWGRTGDRAQDQRGGHRVSPCERGRGRASWAHGLRLRVVDARSGCPAFRPRAPLMAVLTMRSRSAVPPPHWRRAPECPPRWWAERRQSACPHQWGTRR